MHQSADKIKDYLPDLVEQVIVVPEYIPQPLDEWEVPA
jgi:hypothetical protein